jgi:hypothetical protein
MCASKKPAQPVFLMHRMDKHTLMKSMERISTTWRALVELGPAQPSLFGLYRLGLHSGYFRWRTSTRLALRAGAAAGEFRLDLSLPEAENLRSVLGRQGVQRTLAEADEIVQGRVRLFGGPPVFLQLQIPGPLAHWTAYELGSASLPAWGESAADEDIKFTWEPARFGWVYTLGRAYRLSGEERYASAFWEYVERFLHANPPFLGPNWSSAQEVAIRLIALAFGLKLFAGSPHTTPLRREKLVGSIAIHAARLPVTIVYGLAQNNNHLLSEAAALYTAGVALPNHPQADQWRALGWRWFNYGLQKQIDKCGAYVQHSTNYHRMLLQLALWFRRVAALDGRSLPMASLERLSAATRWLATLVDAESGCVPNLGPNDGAYIQPLTACSFEDYRPVVQAACLVFLGWQPFSKGIWDEISLWLGKEDQVPIVEREVKGAILATPHILRSLNGDSWIYLRIAEFNGRPGHADQLHLDLWRRGVNLACDPGTYRYTALPPWDNALTAAAVHNTLTVNGRDQMIRRGRFLYLERANAQVLEAEPGLPGTWQKLVAQHDGYRRLGVLHRRGVTALEDGWLVEDALLPMGESRHSSSEQFQVRLHWLLPDLPWYLNGTTLAITSHGQRIDLSIEPGLGVGSDALQVCLARAGKRIAGHGEVESTWGWLSPTYGQKIPALSFAINAQVGLPCSLFSHWRFQLKSGES